MTKSGGGNIIWGYTSSTEYITMELSFTPRALIYSSYYTSGGGSNDWDKTGIRINFSYGYEYELDWYLSNNFSSNQDIVGYVKFGQNDILIKSVSGDTLGYLIIG